jgi:hypothetical protein
VELASEEFFDVIVRYRLFPVDTINILIKCRTRLRDDSYAYARWPISMHIPEHPSTHIAANISLDVHAANSFGFRSIFSLPFKGSMDDNGYVLQREYLEVVMRAIVEDYYFNDSLAKVHWGNYERRLKQILGTYRIPSHLSTNVCHQPIVPVRSLFNSTHWHVHPVYAEAYANWCSAMSSPSADSALISQSGSNAANDKKKNSRVQRRLLEAETMEQRRSLSSSTSKASGTGTHHTHAPPIPKATGLDNFDHFCCNKYTELLFRNKLAPIVGV